jgi:hypothetical protein
VAPEADSIAETFDQLIELLTELRDSLRRSKG